MTIRLTLMTLFVVLGVSLVATPIHAQGLSICPPHEADPGFLGDVNLATTRYALIDGKSAVLDYSPADYGTVIQDQLVVANHNPVVIPRPGYQFGRNAYPIQRIDPTRMYPGAWLRSREHGQLYILAAVDFGVGGVNFDTVFDGDGDLVGVAGDWSITWDDGCHQELPGNSWRGMTLFDSAEVTLYQSADYRLWHVPFSFHQQADADYRQLTAGYWHGDFRVFRIDLRYDNGDLLSCYHYGPPEVKAAYKLAFGPHSFRGCM